LEPWVEVKIITPAKYLGEIMQSLYDHEAVVGDSEVFGSSGQDDSRTSVSLTMPLRELMRNYFNELKSLTSGYASISYEIGEMKIADVVKMDVLVADEVVPAFSQVVSRRRAELEAENAVEKLYKILPRQMFSFKVQGKAMGRIISSRSVSGMKKNVTAHMYGGDITRKMKLRERQKEGKKRMQDRGVVNIPPDVFLKMIRND
jgi:GTP-binding protein LepA